MPSGKRSHKLGHDQGSTACGSVGVTAFKTYLVEGITFHVFTMEVGNLPLFFSGSETNFQARSLCSLLYPLLRNTPCCSLLSSDNPRLNTRTKTHAVCTILSHIKYQPNDEVHS